jgi:hypothetical protein
VSSAILRLRMKHGQPRNRRSIFRKFLTRLRARRILTRYLLDTDIVSDLVRNPQGRPEPETNFARPAITRP